MALGDIYSLTSTVQSAALNTYQNVWFYQQTVASNPLDPQDSELLALRWYQEIWPLVQDCIAATGGLTSVYAYNLFDPEDFQQNVYVRLDNLGDRAGEQLPNFVGIGLRTQRGSRVIRRGRKTLGPISEADTNGNALEGTYQTVVNNSVALMNGVLDSLISPAQFQPVVVARIPYTTSGGKPAYRLPENLAEADFFNIETWEFVRVTSQVSRKAGVGV